MSRATPARRSRTEPARRAMRRTTTKTSEHSNGPDSDRGRESDATKKGRQAAEAVAREHDASANQVKDEPVKSSSHDQRSLEARARANVTGPVPDREADYEEDEARRG